MSVKIRLRRTGKLNAACHRVVVTDARNPRDGKFIEQIGFYDPRHKNETIDLERADYWLGNGAQASDTVSAIIKRVRAGVPLQKKAPVAAKPLSKKAAAKKDKEAEAAKSE